jgi:hypothetical protein
MLHKRLLPQGFSWKEKSLLVGLKGLVAKTNWLTLNRQSESNFDFDFRRSHEMAVTRVGGWCEMDASLRGGKHGNRGPSIVGRCYQAAHWRSWLRKIVFLWQWSVNCSHKLFKSLINRIINPNSLYNHAIRWQHIMRRSEENVDFSADTGLSILRVHIHNLIDKAEWNPQ